MGMHEYKTFTIKQNNASVIIAKDWSFPFGILYRKVKSTIFVTAMSSKCKKYFLATSGFFNIIIFALDKMLLLVH